MRKGLDLNDLSYLLPKTKKVLQKLEEVEWLKHFVMAGGSALALHLAHRQSEDLNFFTYDDWFLKDKIFSITNFFGSVEILNETNSQIDFILDGVKVTFFNAKWKFLNPTADTEHLNIATVEQISAMKTNTMFLRAKFRDYYDLYTIAKERLSVNEIFENAKKIVAGMNFKLFSMALIYVEDIEDDTISHLNPRYDISKEEISAFFINKLQDITQK